MLNGLLARAVTGLGIAGLGVVCLVGSGTADAAGPPAGEPAIVSASSPGLAGLVRSDERPVLSSLRLPAAWKVSRGHGVTVAVLDTGADSHAPDLTGAVTTGPDYIHGANPSGYRPPHLHGTYIASLIAGHGSGPGRTGGVIGAAPAAKVLSIRVVLDDSEPGFAVYNSNPRYTNVIARGIRYAVDHGARVINMSLGSTQKSRATRAALAYAASHGVVVVAAAGNGAKPGRRYTAYSYPASYPGVIAVAAVTAQGRRASFSDRNSSVVVSAPGVSVVGAGPGNTYLQASGTSPASALVAGVAALIRSAYPHLPAALVRQALITSTRHRPSRGYSPATGFGEIDAAAALAAAARLAARTPAHGVSPLAPAGTGPAQPIAVVHRDTARIVPYAAAAAAGALGFVVSLVILIAIAVRGRKNRRRSARVDPGQGRSVGGENRGPVPL